jgi:TNF receptor-associated protein 1
MNEELSCVVTHLNGTRTNTVKAVWAAEPNTIDDETHRDLCKYIAKAFGTPFARLHFRVDANIEVKASAYVPSFHSKRTGMERMKPDVGPYCRKVLIMSPKINSLSHFILKPPKL